MRWATIVLGAALLAGTGAPLASAATSPAPGVHIDPGSPYAKEYAIPLDQARGGGSGGGLFGRGITRVPSHHAPAATPAPTVTPAAAPTVRPSTTSAPVAPRHGARRHRPARRAAHRHRTAAAKAAPAPAPRLSRTGVPAASYGRAVPSGTGLVWMVGVAVLVLALGGLGGAALARYGRRTSASTS